MSAASNWPTAIWHELHCSSPNENGPLPRAKRCRNPFSMILHTDRLHLNDASDEVHGLARWRSAFPGGSVISRYKPVAHSSRRAREGVVVALLALVLVGCTGFRAARLYQQGTAALNTGDAETAISQLGEAARLEPGASEIQNHLGLALAETGQHAKALAAFRRAVNLDCSNVAAARNLAAARAAARDRRALAKAESSGGL